VPFEKVEVKRILEEKRLEPEFNETYQEINRTNELVRILVEARKCLGFTQNELAARAGVKYRDVMRLENEKVLPAFSKLFRITDALKLEIKVEPKEYN